MTREEHPFAQYVRTLGRGKTVGRSLTGEEAEAAMDMILANEVRPEQLGAFLMLLRVKEETPEEVAGFVRSVRKEFQIPVDAPKVDLDWSSYAGKRRQLPWFLLAALVLADDGVSIFMHGAEGHTLGRLYTRETLDVLELPVAGDFLQAAEHIQTSNFASGLQVARSSPLNFNEKVSTALPHRCQQQSAKPSSTGLSNRSAPTRWKARPSTASSAKSCPTRSRLQKTQLPV